MTPLTYQPRRVSELIRHDSCGQIPTAAAHFPKRWCGLQLGSGVAPWGASDPLHRQVPDQGPRSPQFSTLTSSATDAWSIPRSAPAASRRRWASASSRSRPALNHLQHPKLRPLHRLVRHEEVADEIADDDGGYRPRQTKAESKGRAAGHRGHEDDRRGAPEGQQRIRPAVTPGGRDVLDAPLLQAKLTGNVQRLVLKPIRGRCHLRAS
jgi:hypothetical protein